MTSSYRRHEGYMLIDQRDSPGTPEETVIKAGLPAQAARGMFEGATYTCSHCNAVVVIEQKRTRERAFCTGCMQRICDGCGFIRSQDLQCRSFRVMIDKMQEEDLKRASSGNSLVLLP